MHSGKNACGEKKSVKRKPGSRSYSRDTECQKSFDLDENFGFSDVLFGQES
jgi:hypothetical protein